MGRDFYVEKARIPHVFVMLNKGRFAAEVKHPIQR